MTRRLYDISPMIDTSLGVWPGDTPPSREVLLDMARGDNLTLSTLRATVHLGSHADAPSHYGHAAPPASPTPTIERMPLDLYLGPARVVTARVERGSRVSPSDIEGPIDQARVIIRTDTFPDPRRWNDDFAGLEPDLIEHLAANGVRLVGLDTPSVDLMQSKDLPAHHACLRCGVAIIEGLVLREVPDGVYELIALPLKLAGFDASPVRAVLRSMD
ncbi:MAG: cyclase family protein [Phycisphaeraceae bacterium]|nr:cyclase family protein [Phycisphaerales bacterium]MCB9843443.1 cyclase family protein [Phycisphaeraceae bacterium]